MRIIRKITERESQAPLNLNNATKHFGERVYRLEKYGMGLGKCIAGFLVDKGHENGLEEHYITNSGMIVIRNHNTKKAITLLIARPGQIARYYMAMNEKAPRQLMDTAHINESVFHYNYI